MGSFRLAVNTQHLHRDFNFTEFNIGDSGEVVTSFMQVTTYVTRGFATLGPLWLQPPFTVDYIQSNKTYLFTRSVLGRRQTLYKVLKRCRVLCFY